MPPPGDGTLSTDGTAAASMRRATEFAYEHVRRLILAGTLPAGATLSQVQLSKEIGISRTPLREAVRRLQQEGLLVGEVNQRVRVAEAPIEELDSLYALRIATEATAIRMTVPTLTDTELEHIAQALQELESAEPDPEQSGFDERHKRFHLLLVDRAAGRLRATIEDAWDHAERYRRLYAASAGSGGLEQAHGEHRGIVEAVMARDGATAALRLTHHYARVALTLIAHHQPALDTSGIRTAVALVSHAEDD